MKEFYPFNILHLIRFYIPEGHFGQEDIFLEDHIPED